MNKKALALAVAACVGSLAALPAQAQGLRLPGPVTGSGGAGTSLNAPLPPPSSASAGQRQADYIVAIVNSEPVTNNEVRTRALRVQQQAAQQGASLPPRDAFLKQVLDRVILEKAQIQYAREIGIKVEEAQINTAEASVAAQNQVSVADLHRRLTADGITPSQFRDDLRNQMLLQRLRERDFEQRVKVSDMEAEQFLLEQNAHVDVSKMEVNIAQVLVAVPETATPTQVSELQARAQRVYERARGGEDFAALAREVSSAPEARDGGALGLRALDRYPELFVETVRALPAGGVAPPVRSGAGFHVLKLVEKKQSGGVDTSVIEEHARHILLRLGPTMTQAQAAERLATIKRNIQSGSTDFATQAREVSQDGSAREGGDLGWSRPGQFVPEFEDVLKRLAPGQISEPTQSRFGMHLIQLIERREAQLTQREQREIARGMLREKKLDETFANWSQDIRARAYVELREPPQ